MTGRVNLELMQTDVPGLDYLIGGGLPTLWLNIISHEPGSGKTTLAQHRMFSLAEPDRRAVKVRGRAHSQDLRSFEVTNSGFVIGEEALPYKGMLTGSPADPEMQRT